jgi:hypothetical protein
MARTIERSLLCSVILLSVFAAASLADENLIAPGTRITNQNWQQYSRFMSGGMQALFSGKYSWKMPADTVLVVGPTVAIPLPRKYLLDTAKYSGGVSLKQSASGGTAVENYIAGIPFPVPAPPDAGARILWNLYYRYNPRVMHCVLDSRIIDRYGSVTTQKADYVISRLAHLSEPDLPHVLPISHGIYMTDYWEFTAPEHKKYLAQDSIVYDDPARINEIYSFVPAIRKSLRLSSAARCAPGAGSDFTSEDLRFGFYGQPPFFKVKLESERRILAMVHLNSDYSNWNNYLPPVLMPKPSVGAWELRDAYVISLTRVGPDASSYCYGKRTIYVDKETWAPLAVESYDQTLALWKFHLIGYRPVLISNDGEAVIGAGASAGFHQLINIRDQHVSGSVLVDVSVNANAGKYTNVSRYGLPGGLQQIMQ